MAVTANSIITAQAPYNQMANFAAVTACTTRAPTVTASLAAANIIILVNTSTNGCRVDSVRVRSASSSFTAASVAAVYTIWYHNGTTAVPLTEILTTIVSPSTTAITYDSGPVPINMILAAAESLYASVSITTTASTTAAVVIASGALL